MWLINWLTNFFRKKWCKFCYYCLRTEVKDAPDICEDSYSSATSSCFLWWLIFFSSLLAHWFGILRCKIAALLNFVETLLKFAKVSEHHAHLESRFPVVLTTLWHKICESCCVYTFSVPRRGSSFLFQWQDTHLKSEWKYSHCTYDISIIKWKKLSKKYYSLS